MTSSINSMNSAQPVYAGTAGRVRQQGADMKQISESLQGGDVDSAKQAYVDMAKNAAASGKTWDPNSQFAALGRALQSGDVSGAQQALQGMAQNVKAAHPNLGSNGASDGSGVPTGSSTGGAAGTTLDVQA